MSSTEKHQYIAPTASDSRSPCPALNSLANHGYIPRDGKNIGLFQLGLAAARVYNVSYPLALFLSFNGIRKCGHGLSLDLEDLFRHNAVEHDASMARRDVDEADGPLLHKTDLELVQAIIDKSDGKTITLDHLIAAKVDREVRAKLTPETYPNGLAGPSHAELVLIIETLKRHVNDKGVTVEDLKTWLLEERLPEGLTPPQTTGIASLGAKTGEATKQISGLHAKVAEEGRSQ